MIVIGTDTHKRTHTCGCRLCGQPVSSPGELTASAREPGFTASCSTGDALSRQSAIWAIEDCRHVSGSLERFLIASRGACSPRPPEADGRKPPWRTNRAASPTRSTPWQSPAPPCARGPRPCPPPTSTTEALQIKLLLDHREDLVKARSEDQYRLRWHLHDLWPELEIPAGALDRMLWLDRIARKLARAEQGARVRVARELVVEIRRRTRRATELEREIDALVKAQAPELLELEGCGALTAAKLLAETAGARRLHSDAKFARLAGVAPIPASSGTRIRHRLDRGGNRQLNCALHRIAVTQGRMLCPGAGVPRQKAGRGQVQNRSPALPQAPPGAPSLEAVGQFRKRDIHDRRRLSERQAARANRGSGLT